MAIRGVLMIGAFGLLTRDLTNNLRRSGFEICQAGSTREALEAALEMLPLLVLVGIVEAEDDAFEVCRAIARNLPGEDSPAMLVLPRFVIEQAESTGGDTELARLLAIEMLAQSLRTLADCGSAAKPSGQSIRCHGITLDRSRQTVELDGRLLELTPTEFRLLWSLASQPGFVLTREELSNQAHQPENGDKPALPKGPGVRTRKIDVHVKAIRGKLGEKGTLIETVRGIGYRMQDVSAV